MTALQQIEQSGFTEGILLGSDIYKEWVEINFYKKIVNRQQNPIVQAMNSKNNVESTYRKGVGGKRGPVIPHRRSHFIRLRRSPTYLYRR